MLCFMWNVLDIDDFQEGLKKGGRHEKYAAYWNSIRIPTLKKYINLEILINLNLKCTERSLRRIDTTVQLIYLFTLTFGTGSIDPLNKPYFL